MAESGSPEIRATVTVQWRDQHAKREIFAIKVTSLSAPSVSVVGVYAERASRKRRERGREGRELFVVYAE